MANERDFLNVLSSNWVAMPPPPTYEQSTDSPINNDTNRLSIISSDRRRPTSSLQPVAQASANQTRSRRLTRPRSLSEDRQQSSRLALKCVLLILLGTFGMVLLMATTAIIARSLNDARAHELDILVQAIRRQQPYGRFEYDGQYTERGFAVNFLLIAETIIIAFAYVVYSEKKTGVLFFTTLMCFVTLFVGIVSLQIPDTDSVFALYSTTVTFLIILTGFSFAFVGKLKKAQSNYTEFIV